MSLLESIKPLLRDISNPLPLELRTIIAQLELTAEKVSPYLEEPSYLPYGRTVLLDSSDAEVILIHLPAGRQTSIHNHGTSVGCAYIVEGQLTNTIYRPGLEGYVYESGESVVSQGQFIYAPRGQIHRMSNHGAERAVSFHVYTPKMSGLQQFFTYEQVLDFVI